MNYINAEEFLKQSKKVQKVFIDWWKPEFGDLFLEDYWNVDSIINVVGCVPINKKHFEDYSGNIHYKTDLVIPLLTEGQLRKFIEDKTAYTRTPEFEEYDSPFVNDTYYIHLFDSKRIHKVIRTYEIETSNLLKALWKAACQIAQEEINNQKQSIVSENKYGLPVIKGGGQTMREVFNEKYR
ncbi:hypothetical protein [Clostridium botulinum]|uniref:hypothetical protein n=1 Tax=Clostridium botulinum TaxID=1491 RepID=UPI00192A3C71|nr:hypothetical protein [Clostridium botulinum]